MIGAGIALVLLCAGVIWGCVIDYLRHVDDQAAHDADAADHHRALIREIRRHDTDQVRWRP